MEDEDGDLVRDLPRRKRKPGPRPPWEKNWLPDRVVAIEALALAAAASTDADVGPRPPTPDPPPAPGRRRPTGRQTRRPRKG